MKLTEPDEYFNHQVALPHSVVGSSDPNWRERYWLSMQDVVQRNFILTLGFGKYPNQDVMEGFVIVQHGALQYNLRVSRRLLADPVAVTAGPLSVTVIEPLKTLRIRIAANESGIGADFTWHAAMPCMLEGRHFEINRARVSHDLVRYVQLGRIEGEVTLPGHSFRLERESVWAERDHSWGVRPMAHRQGEPPPLSPEWNFLAFCPIQFPAFCLHFYLFEAQAGRPTHLSASIIYLDGRDADDPIRAVDHDFAWLPAAPVITLKSGTIALRFYSGRTLMVELLALAPRVFLKGGGYGVDQGRWKGDFQLEHEVWDLGDPVKLKDHARSSSDHMLEARCDGETGYGIIEYMVRRGHTQYASSLPARG